MTKEELIQIIKEEIEQLLKEESLRQWFGGKTKGWVQVGGKYDGKPCAKQPGQKTKVNVKKRKRVRSQKKKKERSKS